MSLLPEASDLPQARIRYGVQEGVAGGPERQLASFSCGLKGRIPEAVRISYCMVQRNPGWLYMQRMFS